ncbi:uncharacterized protein LOC119068669 [Bradysia coprophila]|uniref:uncharacterized protein LOC119068669 n=1 Tax=Bradysia coprophila TaxID=38358 RepID=UPI00187D9801|nr:uncharacterized protein LOC119068669 [Bradysia coprophila]
MIFRHSIQILCWILIVNSTVKNVRAISFDDIFDYFLDALSESDESDELDNSTITVPCINCNLSVVCHNCTTSNRDTESTIPIQMSTQSNKQVTPSSPLPTPTIPAPDRIPSPEVDAITTQSTSTTIAAPPTSTVTTKSMSEDVAAQAADTSADDKEQVPDDGTNETTSTDSNNSDGVTDEVVTAPE